ARYLSGAIGALDLSGAIGALNLAAQQPVEHPVVEPAAPILRPADDAFAHESGALERTLLGDVADIGIGLHPVDAGGGEPFDRAQLPSRDARCLAFGRAAHRRSLSRRAVAAVPQVALELPRDRLAACLGQLGFVLLAFEGAHVFGNLGILFGELVDPTLPRLG